MPPQKILGGRKLFGGGRKSYLAAEYHNEAAPKKKKKRRFSAWAPKNIAPQAPAEKADFWFWAPNKKKIGGRNFLGGARKSYLTAEHHNEAAPKKKKGRFISAWAPKNTTLGRLRSKGLEPLRTAKDKLHSPRPRIAG